MFKKLIQDNKVSFIRSAVRQIFPQLSQLNIFKYKELRNTVKLAKAVAYINSKDYNHINVYNQLTLLV